MILSGKTKYQIFNLKSSLNFNLPLASHSYLCVDNLQCNCLKVEQTDNMKYLGLMIDSRLTWKIHIAKLKKEIYRSLRNFYLLKNMCPEIVLSTLYHALVNSRFSYGLWCWGGTYFSTLQPLFIIQKHFIRLIAKRCRLTHSWPLFTKYKILPLRHLYVFKVLRNFYNRSSNLYNSFDQYYNLRKNSIAPVPKSNIKHHQQFYYNSAPRLFNIISNRIDSRQNLNLSLKGVKNYLLSNETIEHLFNTVV